MFGVEIGKRQKKGEKMIKKRCISPSKNAHVQKNIETFRRTFQKPSQIYRFLSEIWKNHPLYLNRSLSYVSKYRDQRKGLKIRFRNKKERIEYYVNQIKGGSRDDKVKDQIEALKRNGDRKSVIVENIFQSDKQPKDNICYFDWICDDPESTSQKTRSRGYSCPWCDIKYSHLDSLMHHLICCHLRFNFELAQVDDQTVIRMTLNRSFDGSYCGFKYPGHDLRSDFKFTPDKPRRHNPLTQIIHFRARQKHGLANITSTTNRELFNFDDGEADVDVCSGRLYYHTSTCLPIKPNEVDIDSEADIDPDWLRERSQLMIDEFTDVNEGEKEILKLWNLHIMTNFKYKGDNMMPQACLDFVESQGPTIVSKNLRKNFILHLANLYDFGLIGSEDLLDCMRKLKKLKAPSTVTSSPSKLSAKTKLDRNSNEHCQHLSPAKRALSY